MTGVRMAVPYQILVGGDADIEAIVNAAFAEVDATYNNWNPDSEVSHLNALPPHTPIALSEKLYHFLKRVDALVRQTDGAFDPTIGYWDKIHFENGVFSKEVAITLDLGGCAKGYCVDLITERLLEAGYPDVFVNWGGDIRAEGHHPSGRPWRVAIEGQEVVVELTGAIATSGHDKQAHEGLSHIYNPKTHKPLPATTRQVTVKENSCLEADALATALSIDPNLNVPKFWIYD